MLAPWSHPLVRERIEYRRVPRGRHRVICGRTAPCRARLRARGFRVHMGVDTYPDIYGHLGGPHEDQDVRAARGRARGARAHARRAAVGLRGRGDPHRADARYARYRRRRRGRRHRHQVAAGRVDARGARRARRSLRGDAQHRLQPHRYRRRSQPRHPRVQHHLPALRRGRVRHHAHADGAAPLQAGAVAPAGERLLARRADRARTAHPHRRRPGHGRHSAAPS